MFLILINIYFIIQADGEQTKYILIVNELIQDSLFKAYKDFMKKAQELMQP